MPELKKKEEQNLPFFFQKHEQPFLCFEQSQRHLPVGRIPFPLQPSLSMEEMPSEFTTQICFLSEGTGRGTKPEISDFP